jgi:hypothetical protein
VGRRSRWVRVIPWRRALSGVEGVMGVVEDEVED